MSTPLKIHVSERANLNMSMFNQKYGVKLVKQPTEADFIISQSTIKYPDLMHKTVYIAAEPPRTKHRQWCYNNFDNMMLVVVYNPDPTKPNQISFQPNDEAQWYPTRADPYPYTTRTDTKMTTRGVFFAGVISETEPLRGSKLPDNAKSITHLRKTMGEYFLKHHEGSVAMGIGWKSQSDKVSDWRAEKWKLIKNPNIDFVLALENTIQSNYLSEKLWDGIACDKVTLYLGDPRIEHHIPTNCFIDLRDYYNSEIDEIDMESVSHRLKTISQAEYNIIIANARKIRKIASGKYQEYSILMTARIFDILKRKKAEIESTSKITDEYLRGVRDCKRIYSIMSPVLFDISPEVNRLVVKCLKGDGEFYSLLGQQVQHLIRIQNASHPLDQLDIKIDGSSTWSFYKDGVSADLYELLFCPDYSVKVEFPYTGQGVNSKGLVFKHVKLNPLNLMLNRYFSMSDVQKRHYDYIISKYSIDVNNTIGVCYTGTDKFKEVILAEPTKYTEVVQKILNANPNMKVLIQTDWTQVKQLFISMFKERCFFISEIPTTETDGEIHKILPTECRLEFVKTLDVSVRILSRCKYIVNCSSDVAWIIAGYRGNSHGMWQFDYEGTLFEPDNCNI